MSYHHGYWGSVKYSIDFLFFSSWIFLCECTQMYPVDKYIYSLPSQWVNKSLIPSSYFQFFTALWIYGCSVHIIMISFLVVVLQYSMERDVMFSAYMICAFFSLVFICLAQLSIFPLWVYQRFFLLISRNTLNNFFNDWNSFSRSFLQWFCYIFHFIL